MLVPEAQGAPPGPGRVVTVVIADHDRAALEALWNATRHWHDRWEVHLVDGTAGVVDLLDRLPHVDVLVADLDLPGIPAADLLALVRDRSPRTARLVMSQRSDRASVIHLITAAHRYLPKPVDVPLLAGLVEQIRDATGRELREPVSSLIGQVDRLPKPPALFQRLTAMMASETWTIDAVAAELRQDVALTAEVVRLVNSAFYGVHREVTSVDRAIALVGIDMIRSVVLGSSLFRPDDALETWLDLDRLDRRSKAVALAARAIAVREGAAPDAAAAAHLAGMVSEIGMLVLARLPDISPSIAQPLNVKTYIGAERAIFGGDRFEVGSELLRLWGFGAAVTDALARLSHPEGHPADGLAWHLRAGRWLIVNEGFDPIDLATAEADAAVGEALERLRGELDGAASAA